MTKVGTDGSFVVRLRAGTYTVTGHSPDYYSGGPYLTCYSGDPIEAAEGTVTEVTVSCPIG